MADVYRAAAVQMSSGEDTAANLLSATQWIEQAAAAGAHLVVLPEMFVCLGRVEAMLASAEGIPGPTSDALCQLARRLRITLVAGSFAERSPRPDKVYNTSLLIGPDGAILARYRKMHLFDVDLPGQVSLDESSWITAGDQTAATSTPQGCIGQAICYDLRFPELFRQLADAGADVICVPAAFTLPTGRDHWEVLVRARAIENQAFVVAANQFGRHTPQLTSYGRSMIVDPWGTPLAIGADGVGLAMADIDLTRMAEIRRRLPALEHRRARPDA
jgi:deaminated glutathione amidase